MISDYIGIAFRNLRRRGIRSYLTLLGIFIGIAVVISLISLGNGLKVAVNSQFGISSTQVISVQAGGLTGYGPPGTGVIKPLTKDDAIAISKLNNVEKAVGRNVESLKLEYNSKSQIGFTTNIPSGEDRKFVYETIEISPLVGRLLKDGDSGVVVLGYNYYTNEETFGKIIKPGNRVLISGKSFEVIGITEKKGSFIFDNIIYMNEKDLEELTGDSETLDLIAVHVKTKEDMPQVKEDIERILRKIRNVKIGQEDFEVSTPEQALSTVNQILTGVQIFIVLIALISILVGAVGIVNTMTTSVLERKKEIGTMKAIGARNSDIFYQFFIEAGLLGLIGGIAGVVFGIGLGYLGTLAINNFIGSSTTPEISVALIVFALLGSFVIGSVSGIAPALRAAHQNPVEALRG